MAQKLKKRSVPGESARAAALLPPAASALAVPGTAEVAEPRPFLPFSYAAFAALGRDNLAAAAQANAAFSQGIEALGQELMACAREALTNATEAAHGFLGAQTLEDVVKLQADFAKRNFDGLVTGTVKLSELGCSLASATMAPLGNRVGAAMARLAPIEA